MENKNIPTPPPTATDGDGSKKVPPAPSSTAGDGVSIADISSSTPPPITDQNNADRQSSVSMPPKESTSINSSLASNQSHKKWLIWFLVGFIIIGLIGVIVVFVLNKNTKISKGTKIEIKDNTKKSWFGKDKSTRSDENENIVGNRGMIADKCRADYDKLLEVNGFDFDRYCLRQKIRSGDYKGKEVKPVKNNMIIIFDSSGSMAAKLDGKSKIAIAKEAVKKFVDKSKNDSNLNLGIVVYGHKGSNSASQKNISCAGIDEIYTLGSIHPSVITSKLDSFRATGWTPIASSLRKAKDILVNHKDEHNFILLVSDGKETCGGNPVEAINEIKNTGLNVKVDVIGFDVGGADESQLKSIAEAGNGDYFSAKNAYDLDLAFQKHKEMLNKANYKIGRTVEGLYDVSYIINTYGQCRSMLEKERAAMMLDIYGSKLVSSGCAQPVESSYNSRYDTIFNKLKSNFDSDMQVFQNIATK